MIFLGALYLQFKRKKASYPKVRTEKVTEDQVGGTKVSSRPEKIRNIKYLKDNTER